MVLVSVETFRGRDAPRFFRSAFTKSMAEEVPLAAAEAGFTDAAGGGFVLGGGLVCAQTLPGH